VAEVIWAILQQEIPMNRTTAIIILLFAAALEAGGDAVIRVGHGIVLSCLRLQQLFSSAMA
jgi:hypothetical protein